MQKISWPSAILTLTLASLGVLCHRAHAAGDTQQIGLDCTYRLEQYANNRIPAKALGSNLSFTAQESGFSTPQWMANIDNISIAIEDGMSIELSGNYLSFGSAWAASATQPKPLLLLQAVLLKHNGNDVSALGSGIESSDSVSSKQRLAEKQAGTAPTAVTVSIKNTDYLSQLARKQTIDNAELVDVVVSCQIK